MPVVRCIPVPESLTRGRRLHLLHAPLSALLPLALVGLGPPASSRSAPSSRELLDRIWRGVQERHESGCWKLTETRVSPLLVRPLVMHGNFCAAGLDRFRVDYEGPKAARVVYNRGVLNVSTDGGKHTEVFNVSHAVQRAQRYFSGPRSSVNLEHDFSITATETSDRYVLLLLPVSGRIAGRVKRVAIELGKVDFLPRRIEIDGKSGVDSIFETRIEKLDSPLDESLFEVYRP
jgi:hypothetical protein